MSKLSVALFAMAIIVACASDVNSEQISNCGQNKIKSLGLIHGGDNFVRGKWPWTVALKKKSLDQNEPHKYFCSGTLISNTQVVTGKVKKNFSSKFFSSKLHLLYQ